MAQQNKDIFEEIDQYWSDQRISEVYLKDKKNVERGSQEYWDIIESQRLKYIYYLPDILNFFNMGTGKVLLEVGCGMGTDLGYFINHGFNGTGIDLAKEHLDLAEKYFQYRNMSANLYHQNAESLEFSDNVFDCVHSIGVLHHTENPQNGIDEIYRVLKPEGRCAVMLYHRHSLNNLVHKLFKIPFDNTHDRSSGAEDANFVFRYNKNEIKEMFKKFSDVKISVEYLYGVGWEPIYSWTPKWLYQWGSKLFGWHLVIFATK